MSDPREAMGLEVYPTVMGPFEIQRAAPLSPDAGGTLDVGIIARDTKGRRVVIGEIWAACPGDGGAKIRIDARSVAQRIVDTLNTRMTS